MSKIFTGKRKNSYNSIIKVIVNTCNTKQLSLVESVNMAEEYYKLSAIEINEIWSVMYSKVTDKSDDNSYHYEYEESDSFVSIFDKLMETRQSEEFKGFDIVRVTIREDEEFGEAIIERPDGTPSTWTWDKERRDWI